MKDNLTRIAPLARYHSNRLDQIDRLIHAAEADEDIAYLARLLALCSLPRTNPGNRKEYVRTNGPFTLALTAGFDNKLPFGYIARLLLAWVCTEAVRTQSQDLTLGKTLSDFMRVVGIDPAGASYARVRDQMRRLFACSITLVCKDAIGCSRISSYVADRHEFWWNHVKPEDRGHWRSEIRLGEGVFTEIIRHPVPLDMNILKALKRSSLGLDLYLWLNYRTFWPGPSLEDFLEATLRTVRTEPSRFPGRPLNPARAGQERSERFPHQSHPGADKDQARVARPGLCHASGSPGIVADHNPIGPRAHEGRPAPAGRPVPIRRSPGFKFLHNRRGAYYVFLMTTCS